MAHSELRVVLDEWARPEFPGLALGGLVSDEHGPAVLGYFLARCPPVPTGCSLQVAPGSFTVTVA
jgi:hypothetical protein